MAALSAITLTACGAVGASSSSVSTAASTASRPAQANANQATESSALVATRCSSSQLALSYAGTQGATGHLEATFRLRNVSPRNCTLRGYPGAELLNAAGHTIPTHLERGHGFFPDTLLVPRQVLLKPGTSAQFGLGFADNNEYVGGSAVPVCRLVEVRAPQRVWRAPHCLDRQRPPAVRPLWRTACRLAGLRGLTA